MHRCCDQSIQHTQTRCCCCSFWFIASRLHVLSSLGVHQTHHIIAAITVKCDYSTVRLSVQLAPATMFERETIENYAIICNSRALSLPSTPPSVAIHIVSFKPKDQTIKAKANQIKLSMITLFIHRLLHTCIIILFYWSQLQNLTTTTTNQQ